jgi:hypothetical protein
MGNTGRTAAKVTGAEEANEEAEDEEFDEERGMRALEDFIPNVKRFAENMS